MAKISQDNLSKKQKIYAHRYAAAISVFGALSIITQLYGYNVEVENYKALFVEFSSKYTEPSQTFKWVLKSSPSFSMSDIIFFGIITGLVLFFLIISLNLFFRIKEKKWDGKQPIGDVLVFGVYLIIFVLVNNANDPISLTASMNFVWGIGFAIVCGWSSHLLLIHDRLANERNIKTAKFGKEKHKWQFLGQLYQIELAEYQGGLTALIAVTASLVAGLAYTALLQYTFSLPSEIGFSPEFGIAADVLIAKLLLLAIGLILGVIYQLMFEIHSVRNCIKRLLK
jgi:hypothetical protein